VAFGGWDRVDTDRVLQLKATVVRQRQMPRIAARHPGPEVAAALAEFTGYHAAIYAAARELTGAEVVVDSSKFPPLALALAHDPRVDLRTVHIVRDVRGVAFSWSKTVSRPETGGSEEMPRYSPAHSSVHWWPASAARCAGCATRTWSRPRRQRWRGCGQHSTCPVRGSSR
jgi:hypothetical protein